MRKFIGRIFAWIGVLTVAIFILVFVIATVTRSNAGKIPSKTILEVNLETGIAEDTSNDPFVRLGRATPVLRDMVEALEKARDDERVVTDTGERPGQADGIGNGRKLPPIQGDLCST